MNGIDGRLIISGIVSLVSLAFAGPAYAACTMPGGAPDAQAGDLVYNTDESVMQYCNGSDWVGMGGEGGAGDNLGDHTATTDLNMAGQGILDAYWLVQRDGNGNDGKWSVLTNWDNALYFGRQDVGGGGAANLASLDLTNGNLWISGNVGIRTNPGYVLHALSETPGDVVNLDNFTSSGLGGGYSIRTARGTAASPAIVQDDDRLGAIFFQGYDGSVYSGGVATIFGEVDGAPGVGDMPTRLTFHTTPDGSLFRAERMRIDSAGNVGIGISGPLSLLHVGNGEIRIDGPAGNQAGCIRYNDDDDVLEFSHDCSDYTEMGGGGGGGGGDILPEVFDFADMYDQTRSTVIEATGVVVTGFDGPLEAHVTSGTAEIRANNTGSWVTTALAMNPGDTLNIRQTSSGSYGGTVTSEMMLGTLTVDWMVESEGCAAHTTNIAGCSCTLSASALGATPTCTTYTPSSCPVSCSWDRDRKDGTCDGPNGTWDVSCTDLSNQSCSGGSCPPPY